MKAWLAMRISFSQTVVDRFGTEATVMLEHPENDILGAMLVFKTKKAARKIYGRKIKLTEVEFEKPVKGEAE